MSSPKPKSLRVLPLESPLRGSSPFLSPQTWDQVQGDVDRMPRALRALAQIVDGGLCHRCGSCVGICPTKVLATEGEEYPRIANLSACTDCDLCVKVCPGDEFNYRLEHQELHGTPGILTDTHGAFISAAVGYSTEPTVRENSTSGGIVTGLLLDLLDRKEIDGAVIVGSSESPLWKGRALVARTRDELLGGMKSKYAIVPTNSVFSEIRDRPGKYAIVGLPCQIHGFRKAARLDERVKERVVLSIGLFCHAAIEHEAFGVLWNQLENKLGEKTKTAKKFISRIGKHPGGPHLELQDGSLYPVYFGERKGYRPTSIEVINILYRLYTPVRCTTCFDALAEFADISVGDPWMAPPTDEVNFYEGWSFVMCRTARGQEIYERAVRDRKMVSVSVTEREARACNKMMATEKKWRAFRVIETHRRQGKPIPNYGSYDMPLPEHSGLQFIETELHMLSHVFCFLPRVRAAVLRFFLGTCGYWFFWINHKRRVFRFWRRDAKALLSRKVLGRK